MNDSKFLGVCVVIAAIIIGGSIIYQARTRPEPMQFGRYQFQAFPTAGSVMIWEMDTATGEVKTTNAK
jgi:hypothetical protein